MKYPLTAITLATRDGTLTQDAKAVNVLGGQKRPGLITVAVLPAGAGQGMMMSHTLGALAIIGNSIYSVTTGLLVAAIPGGVGPYETVRETSGGLLAFKDGGKIWTLVGSTVTNMAAAPTGMLPGFVYLDSTYYVMTTDGKIHGSGLNDLTTWDPLNMLVLNAELGTPVAIAKQLNYVVGFAANFSIFYYDAANPSPGSPLSPAQSTFMGVGCASAKSIAEVSGMTVFIGKAATTGRSIYAFVQTQYQVISDIHIDKILGQSNLSDVSAFALKIAGKDLYLLTLRDIGVTLVLDFNSKQWVVWTSSTTVVADPIVAGSYAQTYFLPKFYLELATNDLLLHETNGKVYQMLPSAYQDDGLPIDVNYITQQVEGESSDFVRVGAVEVVGDKITSNCYVRFTDDDYGHWSNWRVVGLGLPRSQAVRQGATRRRAYQVRHTDNTPLNLRGLALDIEK